ncbi:hypothetical protein [Phormidium sp. CCY1219]|uniref:hypothetical protein n=1 Tax=Phormidium sp. CCY1219 TaxID=2886104 RepID=UPI002D1F67A4|nr:hypothetical protein [Phormidium sp. CCY1219]MEB3828848.1 hypothetical protein [Phormidium sp. CCY1219]
MFLYQVWRSLARGGIVFTGAGFLPPLPGNPRAEAIAGIFTAIKPKDAIGILSAGGMAIAPQMLLSQIAF